MRGGQRVVHQGRGRDEQEGEDREANEGPLVRPLIGPGREDRQQGYEGDEETDLRLVLRHGCGQEQPGVGALHRSLED